MVFNEEQKKCYQCEELIHPYAESCPYCGCTFELSSEQQQFTESIPSSVYQRQSFELEKEFESPSLQVVEEKDDDQEAQEDVLAVIKPTVLLLSGTVFLLFGLSLFLFSHNGVLTLSWNSHWWPFYLILAFPMLFFGSKSLSDVDEVV